MTPTPPDAAPSSDKTALVLSGGGARGAYQVGVLKAILEISSDLGIEKPFQIYSGISAGAINATSLAAYAHHTKRSAALLSRLWSNLTVDHVFSTDPLQISLNGFQWLRDLMFGGFVKDKLARALLNTQPLAQTLNTWLPFRNIETNIQNGWLEALTVTATDYGSSTNIAFIQSASTKPLWKRSRRQGEYSTIKVEHLMASSALPLFFPPVRIGHRYFGDGCIRNTAPISPAIHLGASKLVVVGVRRPDQHEDRCQVSKPATIAQILGVALNAVLLDALEIDVERICSVNRMLEGIPLHIHPDVRRRKVAFLWFRPSEDLGRLAKDEARKLPKIIRFLLGGLGSTEDAADIISYLLFHPSFLCKLIDLGYADVMKRKEEVEMFFRTPAYAQNSCASLRRTQQDSQ